MPVLLVALFIVVPLAELYVIVQVGQLLGLLPTIGLLLLDSVLGSLLLRSQGRTAWRRFNAAFAEGRMPHREILDGVMVIFGGALLLTPGFLTDVFGVALLIPPSRALIGRGLTRLLSRRIVVSVAGSAGAAARRRASQPRRGATPAYDVEGSATDPPASPPQLGR